MHDEHLPGATQLQLTPNAQAKSPPRKISSKDLFCGVRELVIDHEGRLYHLRITQNGKLILTA